jgi:uracil phosphoribosyltransferase
MVHNLSDNNSIIWQYLNQIRDKEIQKDGLRFRKNMERVGQIIAYEISKELTYTNKTIETPLSTFESKVLAEQPVICSILRAGLAMQQGFLTYFDEASAAFVSAYRKHSSPGEFEIVVEYMAAPSLLNKTIILIDPMLATGRSMHLAYKALCRNGKPSKVFIASLIASKQGIEYVNTFIPHAEIYTAAIDNELNKQSYIIPGLGDAGDLLYGEKI